MAHVDAALQVAAAVFQVFEREGQLATLFDHLMYEHYLASTVNAFAKAMPMRAIPLFCGLLRQTLRIERRSPDGAGEDYTYYTVGPLATDDLASHGVGGALVAAIANLAKAAIAQDQSSLTSIVEAIRSYRGRIYQRIALHLLAAQPDAAPDLAEASLTDLALVDTDWCAAEYAELANAWFPRLSVSAQDLILAHIDAIPRRHLERYRTDFEQYQKRSLTAEDEREYRETTFRDIVWGWRVALPPVRRDAVAATVAEFGDVDTWRARHFAPEQSPLTAEAMRTQSIDETVAFLDEWRPEEGLETSTASALSNALQHAVSIDPKAFSANAEKFGGLRPVFVRALLEGLQVPAANGAEIAWGPLLALMSRIVARASGPNPDFPSVKGDDPDWFWTLRAMVQVLASGLRRGVERVSSLYAGAVGPLVINLYRRVSAIPPTDGDERRDWKHVYFSALQTSRGGAIELCVLLLYWLSKCPESEVGKSPREALALSPYLQDIFEAELADRSVHGWIPRAILGRHLGWLFYFGEAWLRARLETMFPADDKQLRDAAWLAHLQSDQGPLAALLDALRGLYIEQIDSLADDTSASGDLTNKRLAEYVILLYLYGALPEDLLVRFWACAPLPLRQHAIWFVGRHLASEDAEIKARARSYWALRLTLAAASPEPDLFRRELGTIGQFFYWRVDPDWLADQLLRMLMAGFAPNDPTGIVDGLAERLPEATDQAVEIAHALVKHPLVNSWIFLAKDAALRRILVAGKASGSDTTRDRVQEIISLLAARGNSGFVDLAVV